MSGFVTGLLLIPVGIAIGILMSYIANKYEKTHPEKIKKYNDSRNAIEE